ncbi:MAG TPA: hypothetical protein GXX14_03470 [Clostridiaceae bacterium]|nr:hypothetical protein [Clostridiaceae bacterium]
MKKKVVLIVVIALVLSICGYVAYTIHQIRNPDTLFKKSRLLTNEDSGNKIQNGQENPQKVADTKESLDNPTNPVNEKDLEKKYAKEDAQDVFNNNRVNILLLGFDLSPERKKMGVFRTDTIMLASIDFKNMEVYLLSIPRDSYTEIPGFEGRYKINDAFNKGGGFEGKGFEKVMETVSNFIGGISVDYYLAVDMTVFKKVIDMIGGIEYYVDVPVVMNGRELKPGLQILSGQQVLDYARNRNTKRADIDRIDRQQRILLAAFEQLKEKAQLTLIPEIFLAVKDDIWTNMNIKQVTSLALFGTNISMDRIHRYTVPGGFLLSGGLYYWGIKQYEKRDMIKEIFGVTIEVNEKDDIEYLRRLEEEKNQKVEAAESNNQQAAEESYQEVADESYQESTEESHRETVEGNNQEAADENHHETSEGDNQETAEENLQEANQM